MAARLYAAGTIGRSSGRQDSVAAPLGQVDGLGVAAGCGARAGLLAAAKRVTATTQGGHQACPELCGKERRDDQR